MTIETIELMFDGVLKECLIEHDRNGEIICRHADRFVKFPKGTDLLVAAAIHNKANSLVPIKAAAGSGTMITDIPKHITKAVAINLETGEELVLGTKEGKHCHFFDKFPHDVYDIQLRLDWHDIDVNGDPTLDADFFLAGKTKPLKEMRRIPAHHTAKGFDSSSGKILYEFGYNSLKLKLIIQLTNVRTITGLTSIKSVD